MNPLDSPGNRLSHERDRRMFRALGVLIAGFGGFALAVLNGWTPFEVGADASEPAALGFGGLIVVCGIAVLFFRQGSYIEGGIVHTWWRIGPIGATKTRALDECETVCLDTRHVRSNNSSSLKFVVQLRGAGPKIELARFDEFSGCREFGEKVAQFVDLPLVDATGDT